MNFVMIQIWSVLWTMQFLFYSQFCLFCLVSYFPLETILCMDVAMDCLFSLLLFFSFMKKIETDFPTMKRHHPCGFPVVLTSPVSLLTWFTQCGFLARGVKILFVVKYLDIGLTSLGLRGLLTKKYARGLQCGLMPYCVLLYIIIYNYVWRLLVFQYIYFTYETKIIEGRDAYQILLCVLFTSNFVNKSYQQSWLVFSDVLWTLHHNSKQRFQRTDETNPAYLCASAEHRPRIRRWV